MKALIIGGGTAGLAAAFTLRKAGLHVALKERAPQFTEVGLGFIILPNGLEALDTLGAGEYVRQHGNFISSVVIREPYGSILKKDKLENTLAIKRSTCIDALRNLIPAEIVQNGCEFSHFDFDQNGNAVAANFINGVREEADIFIAADGANSAIRKLLLPFHKAGETKIREMVGIADLPEIVEQLDNQLLKTQSTTEGLSIGLLPCNKKQLIWYIQFDSSRYDITNLSYDGKKAFAKKILQGWSNPIHYVLENTDYNKVFLWLTRDMEVLPAFHRNNIVLMGDAAHLVLPFTSQGVNSALQDAITLADLLKNVNSKDGLEQAFITYHQKRKEVLEEYHFFGNMMAKRFLYPLNYQNEDIVVPLAK